jgi:hypothetical protein
MFALSIRFVGFSIEIILMLECGELRPIGKVNATAGLKNFPRGQRSSVGQLIDFELLGFKQPLIMPFF